jgi:hypothetical protein
VLLCRVGPVGKTHAVFSHLAYPTHLLYRPTYLPDLRDLPDLTYLACLPYPTYPPYLPYSAPV